MADPEDRVRQLPREGYGSRSYWAGQIEWAEETRKRLVTQKWRLNLDAYRDEVVAKRDEAVRVNIEFEKTEQKRHQLFYRVPTLKLEPAPRTLRDQQTGGGNVRRAVAIFQEILKHLAGRKGINSKALMDQLIFDVLCPAGIAAAKVGYERSNDGEVRVPTRFGPDPTASPSPLDLGGPPAPQVPLEYGTAPNTVHERYYASRISPGDLLIPPEFTGMDYNDADWLGYNFTITKDEAERRGWHLPADAKPGADEALDRRLVPLKRYTVSDYKLDCVCLYYWAARVDPKVAHPLKLRRLIFVKGVQDPVVHQDCKDQVFDPRGRLVEGLTTNPIKVLTLRYVSDYPYPPSDCSISRNQADELSEFRTQMAIHRRRSVPLRWVNIERIIGEEVRDLVQKGRYYDLIPVEGDGRQSIGEVARPAYPRENFAIADHMMNDANRAWSLGANQTATRETAGTTATEIAAIERATANRLSGEQELVMGFWLEIVETIGQLVQLYADREDAVQIVGEDGAKLLEAWDRHTVQGEFVYAVVPDSASKPDAASSRELATHRYNLMANEPYINRKQLVRETLEALGVDDPDRLLIDPQPPPPEGPRVSASFKGDDINPMAPQYQNVVTMLQAAGLQAQMSPAQGGPGQLPLPLGNPAEGASTEPADVIDRERLRTNLAGNADARAGGLVGASAGR